jgi:hypothetical protein
LGRKGSGSSKRREGKSGGTVVGISPHGQNIEQVAGEVYAMGMARCSTFPKLDSHLGIPTAALSGGAHQGHAVLKGIDVPDH